VKILVALKQVADPDHASRIGITPDGRNIDTTGLEKKVNPFDEYALEAALRLTENGETPKQRLGEVIVVTLGPRDAETVLRSALATGADRAIRVEGSDGELDGRRVAKALATLAERTGVDLILLGKQTVDGDGNEVAQRLAARLDWPQSTFTAALRETDEGALVAEREVDGGTQSIALRLPAVVSVDLRIVAPHSVRSRATREDFLYPPGVRFASLPSIMQSRRKPIENVTLQELVGDTPIAVEHLRYELNQKRTAGRIASGVEELLDWLATEAKVL
jgi:electron transfer flavoprotein beta subunit